MAGQEFWREVVARLPLPLLILDQGGNLLTSNQAGDSFLDAGLALRLEGGKVLLRRQKDRELLDAAWAALATSPEGKMTCALPGRTGAPHLIIYLQLVGARAQWVLMALSNVHLTKPPEARLVAECLGLTRTEAQVAALLSTGMDSAEIAARMGLKLVTVRNHLQRAMGKTSAKNQKQLSLMVVRGLSPLH